MVWSTFGSQILLQGSSQVRGVAEAWARLNRETSVQAWKDFTLLAVQMIKALKDYLLGETPSGLTWHRWIPGQHWTHTWRSTHVCTHIYEGEDRCKCGHSGRKTHLCWRLTCKNPLPLRTQSHNFTHTLSSQASQHRCAFSTDSPTDVCHTTQGTKTAAMNHNAHVRIFYLFPILFIYDGRWSNQNWLFSWSWNYSFMHVFIYLFIPFLIYFICQIADAL